MSSTRNLKILYWVVTALVLIPGGGSGVVELLTDGPAEVVESMKILGYPLYLMKILGFAKALGAVAIIAGKPVALKEWAYAGFSFDFLGAIASHILAGDAVHAPPAVICFILWMVSYALWKKQSHSAGSFVGRPVM